MACKYNNPKKEEKLKSQNIKLKIEKENRKRLEESINHIAFNFEYFSRGQNDAGEDFKDWTHEQLIELLNKMVEYSKKTKQEWMQQGNVFSTYSDEYKCNFKFQLPNNIPREDVEWARFRLNSKMRFIGFFAKNCKNIFYVVFLDKEHKFYSSRS